MVKKIQIKDKVKILVGKDRGKTGKVIKLFVGKSKVLVEGINIVKRHVKPGVVSKEGGIISVERPIHASNVLVIDDQTNQPIKLGFKIVDNKKYRLNKKTGNVLEKKD